MPGLLGFPWAIKCSLRVKYNFTFTKELAEYLKFSFIVEEKLENIPELISLSLLPKKKKVYIFKKWSDLSLVYILQEHSVLLQGTGVVFLSQLEAKLRCGGGLRAV